MNSFEWFIYRIIDQSHHFCDNKSVVEMINQSVSGCFRCMALIRVITWTSIRNNVRFFANYVPTKENIVVDALSRVQLDHFWRNITEPMDREKTLIPEKLWPLSKFWLQTAN